MHFDKCFTFLCFLFPENVSYVCQFCGEMFQYLFPLRAHLRFKCEAKRIDNRLTHEKSHNQEVKQDTKILTRMSPSDRRQSGIHRPGFDSEDISVSRKRHAIDRDDNIGGKVKNYENGENQSPPLRNKDSPEKDYNANIHIDVLNDSSSSNPSAFRKVEKSHSPQTIASSPSSMLSAPNGPGRRSPPNQEYGTSVANLQIRMESQHVTTHKDFIMPPGLPTSVLPMGSSSLPTNILDPQLRASMMEAYRFAFPQQYNGTQESIMRSLHGIGADPSKHFVFPNKINTGISYMKSTNPMVDRILHNPNVSAMLPTPPLMPSPTGSMMPSPPGTSMSVFQNWCAKCNASFRMTSDLVYHMRSHHKREFDPVKKKRDDKLKCNICHETFRERHHLTRHMTSHA